MKPDGLWKQILGLFILAVVLYVVTYTWIEDRRHRKGPWKVTFKRDGGDDEATLLINQPALGITNAGIVFRGKLLPWNFHGNVITFAEPQPVPYDLPFGQCAFMDTTFLPGTIVFSNVFGHEIQLIPRVLTIDKREYPWRSGRTLVVSGTNVSENPP
jgi:hypothetical protein